MKIVNPKSTRTDSAKRTEVMTYFNIHTYKSYRHFQKKMCDVYAALVFALAVFSVSLNAQEIEGNTLISKSHSSLAEGVLLGDLSKLNPLKSQVRIFIYSIGR